MTRDERITAAAQELGYMGPPPFANALDAALADVGGLDGLDATLADMEALERESARLAQDRDRLREAIRAFLGPIPGTRAEALKALRAALRGSEAAS